MGTITKIKPIGLKKLNNAEHLNHMSRFRALVPVENDNDRPDILSVRSLTSETLGITGEQLTIFDAECLRLTDLVKESRVSDETALMLEVDKKRDSLVVYLTTSISQMRNSPIAVQATAALSLYNVTKPYVGIYRSANQQETQQIFGLLTDLDKPENAANIAALNLKPVVDELRTTNQQYADLTNQRAGTRAAAIKDNSLNVRARLDSLYDEMTTLAFVQSVANPTTATADFVRDLNLLVDETTALYNLRIGVAKAGKKPGNDRPDEV